MNRNKTCLVCGFNYFEWTDFHGEASCLQCGSPHQVLFYDENKKLIETPVKLNISDKYIPFLKRYWDEQKDHMGLGTYMGDKRENKRDKFYKWLDEQPELLNGEQENKMQTISFNGSSDDLISVNDKLGDREYYADGDSDSDIQGVFNVGGMLRVFAMYVKGAVWTFAVAQVDESISIPDWPIRVVQSPICKYSVQLEIDVPDNVVVFREKNEDK